MLSDGESLYAQVQYGAVETLLHRNSEGSQPANWQTLVYSNRLRYIVKALPSGTILDILKQLARTLNALTYIDQNQIQIISNTIPQAEVKGVLSATATTLPYQADVGLPDAGYALIDSEIVMFTGKTATALTGVTRGVNATLPAVHTAGATLVILDTLIRDADVLKGIRSRLDKNKIFNRIESDSHFFVEDSDSEQQYGVRPYRFDFSETLHNRVWVSQIMEILKSEFSQLQELYMLRVTRNWNIKIGDILNFRVTPEKTIAIKVMSVQYQKDMTSLLGRTVPRAASVSVVYAYGTGDGEVYSDGHGRVYSF